MNCSISYLEDEKIILIKAEGRFDFNEFLLKTKEAVVISLQHECSLVLVDCSLIASGNTNVVKIFNIPEEYEKNEVPRSYKIGLVESKDPDANKNVSFYETVCRNRGWFAQVFPDVASAKRWLHS